MIGCCNSVKDEETKYGHKGIETNHAYGILRIVDIPQEQPPLQLIRVRNPWGSSHEWAGKFADDDEEWDTHKGLKDKL